VANATREEATAIATKINQAFDRLLCEVEEDWEGEFYVRIIAEPGFAPDLSALIPENWEATPWSHPDFRAELRTLSKKNPLKGSG
jgi:hypothetical protein